MPERVQLSRRKGWKMPPNTIKVDRTTKWGNPCIVGVHGTREQCVRWLELALAGHIVLGHKKDADGYLADKLIAYVKMVRRDRRFLVGKNLACWCPIGEPCHVDPLLDVARTYARQQARKRKP